MPFLTSRVVPVLKISPSCCLDNRACHWLWTKCYSSVEKNRKIRKMVFPLDIILNFISTRLENATHCPLFSTATALSSALVSLKLLSRISFSISYVPKITKSKSAPPFTHTKTDAVWAFSYTFFCLHRYILVLCRLFVST